MNTSRKIGLSFVFGLGLLYVVSLQARDTKGILLIMHQGLRYFHFQDHCRQKSQQQEHRVYLSDRLDMVCVGAGIWHHLRLPACYAASVG